MKKQSLKSAIENAENTVTDAAIDAGKKLQGAAKTVEEKGHEVLANADDKLSSLGASVGSAIKDCRESVKETLGKASPKASS